MASLKDMYAWLKEPPLAAASLPTTSALLVDTFDAAVNAQRNTFPHDFPSDMKSEKHRIRIHYRQTNNEWAKFQLNKLLEAYTAHVIHTKAYVMKDYPNFAKYMRDNPLGCLLYTSPSPRDRQKSRMPSSA